MSRALQSGSKFLTRGRLLAWPPLGLGTYKLDLFLTLDFQLSTVNFF